MRHTWKAFLVCGGLALGCGSPQDASVAEVGPHRITVSALRTYVEELPEGLRSEHFLRIFFRRFTSRWVLLIHLRHLPYWEQH